MVRACLVKHALVTTTSQKSLQLVTCCLATVVNSGWLYPTDEATSRYSANVATSQLPTAPRCRSTVGKFQI